MSTPGSLLVHVPADEGDAPVIARAHPDWAGTWLITRGLGNVPETYEARGSVAEVRAGLADFARTHPVPFGVDVETSETLDVAAPDLQLCVLGKATARVQTMYAVRGHVAVTVLSGAAREEAAALVRARMTDAAGRAAFVRAYAVELYDDASSRVLGERRSSMFGDSAGIMTVDGLTSWQGRDGHVVTLSAGLAGTLHVECVAPGA